MPPAPKGREQVRDALLEAATELFAARGPRATSVRDIAAQAGVNHGLVHQYFGSKHALLAAVMQRLADRLAEFAGEVVDAGSEHAIVLDRHWRILARALLDGEDVKDLQRTHPTVEWLLATAHDAGFDGEDAQRQIAHVIAFELGWRLFEPYILTAVGWTEDADELHQVLFDTVWPGDPTRG